MIFIDNYSRTEIYITDLWREWYVPKFTIFFGEITEPYLDIYWFAGQQGTNVQYLRIDYNDVGGYGYANPTSAADLKSIIQGYIDSAWTDIGPGGDLLTAKADLLSNNGTADEILPGGANEYYLKRDNSTSTGLKWVAASDILSAANVGSAINGAGDATPNDTDVVATAESSILKKITWANVKAFLRSYFRTGLYSTSITEVSGTATASEELLKAFTIAAGACVDTDTVIVRALLTFSSGSTSQKVFRIRVDTSASGVTGTVVAVFQNNNSGGTTIPIKIWQDIKCKANGGNTLEAAYSASGAFSQGVLTNLATANISLASAWYIKITSQKAVSGDTTTFKYGDIIIDKA